jgi:hypothetical protein
MACLTPQRGGTSVCRETEDNPTFGIFKTIFFNEAGGNEIVKNRAWQFDWRGSKALRRAQREGTAVLHH